MKFSHAILLALSAILIFSSCKKEEEEPQEEEQQFDTPATKLSGDVILQDKWGNNIFEDRAGTQATLSGQPPTLQVETDNSGRYEYSSIDDGDYSVTVAREGFTSMQINGIQFSRNSPNLAVQGEYQQLPTVTLGKQSTSFFDSTEVVVIYETVVDTFTIIVDDMPVDSINVDTISAEIHFSALIDQTSPVVPDGQYGYRLFIGKSGNTSSVNYLSTMHGTVAANLDGSPVPISQVWTQSEWQSLGFTQGDPLNNIFVVRVYGDDVNGLSYSAPGGQSVFPNLSDSTGVASEEILLY